MLIWYIQFLTILWHLQIMRFRYPNFAFIRHYFWLSKKLNCNTMVNCLHAPKNPVTAMKSPGAKNVPKVNWRFLQELSRKVSFKGIGPRDRSQSQLWKRCETRYTHVLMEYKKKRLFEFKVISFLLYLNKYIISLYNTVHEQLFASTITKLFKIRIGK